MGLKAEQAAQMRRRRGGGGGPTLVSSPSGSVAAPRSRSTSGVTKEEEVIPSRSRPRAREDFDLDLEGSVQGQPTINEPGTPPNPTGVAANILQGLRANNDARRREQARRATWDALMARFTLTALANFGTSLLFDFLIPAMLRTADITAFLWPVMRYPAYVLLVLSLLAAVLYAFLLALPLVVSALITGVCNHTLIGNLTAYGPTFKIPDYCAEHRGFFDIPSLPIMPIDIPITSSANATRRSSNIIDTTSELTNISRNFSDLSFVLRGVKTVTSDLHAFVKRHQVIFLEPATGRAIAHDLTLVDKYIDTAIVDGTGLNNQEVITRSRFIYAIAKLAKDAHHRIDRQRPWTLADVVDWSLTNMAWFYSWSPSARVIEDYLAFAEDHLDDIENLRGWSANFAAYLDVVAKTTGDIMLAVDVEIDAQDKACPKPRPGMIWGETIPEPSTAALREFCILLLKEQRASLTALSTELSAVNGVVTQVSSYYQILSAHLLTIRSTLRAGQAFAQRHSIIAPTRAIHGMLGDIEGMHALATKLKQEHVRTKREITETVVKRTSAQAGRHEAALENKSPRLAGWSAIERGGLVGEVVGEVD